LPIIVGLSYFFLLVDKIVAIPCRANFLFVRKERERIPSQVNARWSIAYVLANPTKGRKARRVSRGQNGFTSVKKHTVTATHTNTHARPKHNMDTPGPKIAFFAIPSHLGWVTWSS
jgi:hypothetical protein